MRITSIPCLYLSLSLSLSLALCLLGVNAVQAQDTGAGNDAQQKQADSDKKNKQYEMKIDADKREGTMNMSRDGSWQVGGGALEKRPDSQKSEADRRRDQQDNGAQGFIRKTFP